MRGCAEDVGRRHVANQRREDYGDVVMRSVTWLHSLLSNGCEDGGSSERIESRREFLVQEVGGTAV